MTVATVATQEARQSTGKCQLRQQLYFLPISSSSSLMGHVDLLFDLLYSGLEMSLSSITQKVPTGFSSNYTHLQKKVYTLSFVG